MRRIAVLTRRLRVAMVVLVAVLRCCTRNAGEHFAGSARHVSGQWCPVSGSVMQAVPLSASTYPPAKGVRHMKIRRSTIWLAAGIVAVGAVGGTAIASAGGNHDRTATSQPSPSPSPGSFFTSRLPLPSEIEVSKAPDSDQALPLFSASEAVAEVTSWIAGNGHLYSVDLVRATAPGDSLGGAPFANRLGWLVVVIDRTEEPVSINPAPQIQCQTDPKSTACASSANKIAIHGNRFYILDPDSGRLWISAGVLTP